MARYWLQFNDREVALPDGEFLIGRGEGCHIRLMAPSVSRRHLRILTVGDAVMAYDLDSRNGTWINDIRVTRPSKLNGGDAVRVGTQSFGIREAPEELEFEKEPDTWDMVLEPKTPLPEVSPDFWRRTIEMDHASLKRAGRGDPTGPTVKNETEAFTVGLQSCAACGRNFEIGQTTCPYCAHDSYSTPKYRTCTGCMALLSESDVVCPKCGLERSEQHLAEPFDPEDRRRTDRHPIAMTGLYVSSSLTFEAEVTNISRGGLFIVAELLDPVGTPADVVLSTDGSGRARFSGEVVHVVDEPLPDKGINPGMGIRFLEMAPTARIWLDTFLKEKGL